MTWAQPGSLFDVENARVAGDKSPIGARQVAPSTVPQQHPLTKDAGPILIKVASFIGDPHARHAEALCKELRERHGLNAYTFSYKHEVQGLMSDNDASKFNKDFGIRPRRHVPLQEPPINRVVLVGDYTSYDDPKGQKTLTRLRKLKIESVPEDIWLQYRMTVGENGRQKSPLNSAMLVPNPHPEHQRIAKDVPLETKRMILEINANAPHSVYENKCPYTLAVAQFKGASIYGETEKAKLLGAGKLFGDDQSPLNLAAQHAISLTQALRQLGWDAYVFHGQYASMVCVGGFEEKLDPRDPRYQDLRVRIQMMDQHHEVVDMREKLATVKIEGMTLTPHAELILTPKPPILTPQEMQAN
jgi:hypothetical protein